MATKTPVTPETPAAPPLFGDVELVGARQRVARTKVDVPPAVLELLKQAHATSQYAHWPVKDQAHFDAMADVLYSAGDLMTATVRPTLVVKQADGTYTPVKKDAEGFTATHVRVSVGKRRGRPATAPAESTAQDSVADKAND